MGYRSRDSYVSRDPAKRARQLANLKRGRETTGPYQAEAQQSKAEDARSLADICHFAERHFVIPETHKPIVLLDWEREIFRDLFSVPDERRPSLALLGMPKKSGKSTIAAIAALWYLVTKLMSEIYIMGPDLQQGQLVIFDKICRAIRIHPYLRSVCKVGKDRIDCQKTGSKIVVLPCNKTAAGLNPDLVIFDELWQFTSLEARRAIDEMTNPPEGLKHSLILVVTYAGFDSDEDTHLWRWYRWGKNIEEGKEPPDPKFYFLWRTDYAGVPWVTQSYLDGQRRRLPTNAYLRFHENRWTSSEEQFIDAVTLDRCIFPEHARGRVDGQVVVGLDIGFRHDCTALAAVGLVGDRLGLVDHALFTPPAGGELHLEGTFERTLLAWHGKYGILTVLFDPYQAIRSAQTLTEQGLHMTEYGQTLGNLVAMTDGLQGLFKSGNLILYEDREVRRHLLNAAVKESTRGWRLVKSNQAKKIDLSVALAMAAQGAVELLLGGGGVETVILQTPDWWEYEGPEFHKYC